MPKDRSEMRHEFGGWGRDEARLRHVGGALLEVARAFTNRSPFPELIARNADAERTMIEAQIQIDAIAELLPSLDQDV